MDNTKIIQEQILLRLGWTEQQYFQFQYETGLKYLEYYLFADPAGQRLLEGQQLFWNWWKKMWEAREQTLLTELGEEVETGLFTDVFNYVHDPLELSCEIKPSKIITHSLADAIK